MNIFPQEDGGITICLKSSELDEALAILAYIASWSTTAKGRKIQEKQAFELIKEQRQRAHQYAN